MSKMSSNELFNLSYRVLEQGHFQDCERVLERVLHRKKMLQAYHNLGFCQYLQGEKRWADAKRSFSQALEIEPSALRSRRMRLKVFRSLQLDDEAQTELEWLGSRIEEPVEQPEPSFDLLRGYPQNYIEHYLYGPLPTRQRGPSGIMGS